MKKLHSYILFVLTNILIPSLSFAQMYEVIEIDHGLYEVEMSKKVAAENTLTQSMNLLKSQKLVQRTDTIFSNIGKTFGAEFMIRSSDNQAHFIPLKIVWEFPKPMTNPFNKKVYKESYMEEVFVTGIQSYFHSYTLEYDYEFVEGWWTLKVMHGNNVLYSKKFLLINML